jgi:hypothetical protein
MNTNPEKILVSLILGILIVTSITSIYWFSALGNPITKEEAIEISKNSELVKESFAKAYSTRVSEANYHNSSWVERMKSYRIEMYAKIPEGHSIWEIVWDISLGVGGYGIIVIVDAEMGMMIHEELGIGMK